MDLGRFGNVDVGGILRANSGLAYSLRSSGVSANATQRALLTRLGYPDRPSSWTIYYSQGRGSETFDGYGVFNLLNNDKLTSTNVTVRPDTSGTVDALGIPTTFTEGSRFGEATSPDNYPQCIPGLDGLRAFQLAFGLRW
ncbi:MAG TPA: hypothetical protein DEQ98_09420 [Acidobacteria bacterium]|nr:hypothetical protein [Acidobacteriota bacterium]